MDKITHLSKSSFWCNKLNKKSYYSVLIFLKKTEFTCKNKENLHIHFSNITTSECLHFLPYE